MSARLAEAWQLAAILVAGLPLAAIGLLFLGRLLGREWLTPLEDELVPAARAAPVAALLAVPLVVAGDRPGWALAWIVAAALGWSLLAYFAASRPGRIGSALGLLTLGLSLAAAARDWTPAVASGWAPDLYGFAFAASQLAPALALALIVNELQRDPVSRESERSLAAALLVLVAAMLWLWFTVFLAAWTGGLPDESLWYHARLEGGRWLLLAGAAAATCAAIPLLVFGSRDRRAIVAAAALILLQHPLHMAWLLRPAPLPAPGLLDAAAVTLFAALWIAAWLALMRRQGARQSGRPGSS